ncbi:MAG: hypothetical protein GY789_21380 [Hyphomicrobiales bacterium]|nr:hypothetical protein [Hyphomicrobiales bacterium]
MNMFRALSVVVVFLFAASNTWAADRPIEDFFGRYIGKTTVQAKGELVPRDLGVEIRPQDNGFTVEWETVITRTDGSTKGTSYKILFQPTNRAPIYSSAMRVNVFGKLTPLDPLSGDPFVWGRITGDTLTVFALLITDEGSYEMQVYNRTLTDSGMDLVFSRVRDGEKLKEIRGILTRIED